MAIKNRLNIQTEAIENGISIVCQGTNSEGIPVTKKYSYPTKTAAFAALFEEGAIQDLFNDIYPS